MTRAALPGSMPWPGQPGGPSTLRQCITLAVLLHVLVVLVFGNTEGGSAQLGQGVWGTLNIRLAGTDARGRPDATVPSDAYSGPQGSAPERRWGGAVRAPADRPDDHSVAGAARQGVWQPAPQPAAPDARLPQSTDAPPAATADLAAAAEATPGPVPVPGQAATAVPAGPPAVSRDAVPEPLPPASPPDPLPERVPLVARPADAATAVTPWRLPAPPAATAQALPLPALNLPAATVPAPAPVPVPVLPPRPAPAPARATRPQGVQAPALNAPALALPAVPDLALPAPEAPPAPRSPAPRAVAPAITAPALPAVQAPVAPPLPLLPAPAPAPVRAPSPPRPVPPAIAAPAAPDAAAATTEALPMPALAVSPTPTPSTAPAAAPAAASPQSPTPPAPSPLPGTATTAAAPAPGPAAQPGVSAGAVARPLPGSVDLMGRAVGAPDAGARVGHDVATAPALPASAPRLDLRLVRPPGGPVSAQGPRGLLPVLPHPPDTPSKLAREIQKAGQPDCRQAYSGMGLLAVVPLLADTARDKGCRW